MKTETTKQLERLLASSFDPRKDFFVFECTIGWAGHEIVDCIKYTVDRKIYCYEIKQSKADFRSKNALTFIGNLNYFVMPYSLYEQVKDEIPPKVGVFVAIDHWETEEVIEDGKKWQKAKYIDGLRELHCIQRAYNQDLKADKEVILSSMLRSMQRDRFDGERLHDKLTEIISKYHIGSEAAVCGIGDTIYIPWVWGGIWGIAEAEIIGMCIDDEGLRFCLDLESDDADFIREYGVLYSYNYGTRWFHKRDNANKKLMEMRREAGVADKYLHEWYDTPQHKLN